MKLNCKYLIMCGGNYTRWDKPRQLSKINDEVLVERTIRLLKKYGATDIAVTTSLDPATYDYFDYLPCEVIHRKNEFTVTPENKITGYYVDAFMLTEEPVCYLFGDVYFSENAIKTIVETEVDGIQFFASAPPFSEDYIKPWAEPFAFKVNDTEKFKKAIEQTKLYKEQGKFKRHPIAWELWQVITNYPLNHIDYYSYHAINDYTCDIDKQQDIDKLIKVLENNAIVTDDNTEAKELIDSCAELQDKIQRGETND